MPNLTIRAVTMLTVVALAMISAHPAAAESPAELISKYRIAHGEARVVSDATLDRIASEQARAMAAKDNLSHETLGAFTSRIAPSRAGRAAENIAYGYDGFEKTLGQWIDSSEHRKNLLLRDATRIGIASAKDASGKRTYWAMEIAGDYEPPPSKGKKGEKVLVAVQGKPVSAKSSSDKSSSDKSSSDKPSSSKCHIKLLGLCL